MIKELERIRLAEGLWNRERPLYQTPLVNMLIGVDGGIDKWSTEYQTDFSTENIQNLYPDPSGWSQPQCQEWLDTCPDRPIYRDEWTLEDWRYAVEDSAGTFPPEIYEWWAVSNWFAEKLLAKGECVLDNDYGTWWGRRVSGQRTALDKVIQDIAVETLR